jgi:Pre-mRNA cleavage complex II protein Clp1
LERVEITEKLQHAILALCHPQAVSAYEQSGKARDLYESGVAGFCVVERVLMETDMIHLLSPCAGNLPSHTLIVGDITWME